MLRRLEGSDVKGSVAVEFALILVLIIWLLIGIAEFSSAWRVKSVMQESVRNGARKASVTPNLRWNDKDIRELVDQMVQESNITFSDYTVGVSWQILDDTRETLEPGDPVTVSMTYLYEPAIVGFIPGLDRLRLKAHSTMRYQFRSTAGAQSGIGEVMGSEPPPPSTEEGSGTEGGTTTPPVPE